MGIQLAEGRELDHLISFNNILMTGSMWQLCGEWCMGAYEYESICAFLRQSLSNFKESLWSCQADMQAFFVMQKVSIYYEA
jgi:hypothetical protein